MSACGSSFISSLRGVGEHTVGDQYVVGGLLAGVKVGVEHSMGFGFPGVDLSGVPVRAEGIQDGGEACAFVNGEIDGERDEVGHCGPPAACSSEEFWCRHRGHRLVIL